MCWDEQVCTWRVCVRGRWPFPQLSPLRHFWGGDPVKYNEMAESSHAESTGRLRGRTCAPSTVFSLSGEGRGLHFMLLFSAHARGYQVSFLSPLKMTWNDSVRMLLRKPVPYPINPLSHFNVLKMISAWWMTVLVSLWKLYWRAMQVIPFKGSSLLQSPKPPLPNSWAASLWPIVAVLPGLEVSLGGNHCLLLPLGSTFSSQDFVFPASKDDPEIW